MSPPINPAPVTERTEGHLPAYLSNGVVGLRVRGVPLRPGLATLSGLEGEHPEARVASVPPVPYPLASDLTINSMSLSDHWSRVQDVVQHYDFATGELVSRFRFSYDGVEANVEVLTFCCRSEPSLVAQQIVVTTSAAADVTVSACVDHSGVPGRIVERGTTIPGTSDDAVDGVLLWETLGAMATCGAAYWTECNVASATKTRRDAADAPLATSYSVRLRKGERLQVRQVTSLVPSANHAQPQRQATRLAANGRRIGFEKLRKENAEAWRELWRGRIRLINADEKWQTLADAAFFYLHTSTHPGSLSTHPFGLAQWHGYHYYYGHVMWDVEAFLLPPLLLTNPDAAGAMLDFRSRTLEAARENARLNGWRGAQFPWEASPARGEEAAPGLGDASAYEHHVTPDVAVAFARYAHATGDEIFAATRAWPVLAAAAEWIASRAVPTKRGWEIPRAMGIAERENPADNAAFVNMASSVALDEAVALAEHLGLKPPAAWRSIARGLVLPVNRSKVILDHDGYTRREEKASTPAALAGLFPLGYRTADDVEQATLRFYLDMADDYVGAPMLSAFLGVWAAMLPDRSRSSDLFEAGYAAFADERFSVVREYRADKFPDEPVSAPFLANLGGFLMALLYGLTGVQIGPGEPASWCQRRVVMPDLWDGVEVERIRVRGRAASLHAKHGEERAAIDLDG